MGGFTPLPPTLMNAQFTARVFQPGQHKTGPLSTLQCTNVCNLDTPVLNANLSVNVEIVQNLDIFNRNAQSRIQTPK